MTFLERMLGIATSSGKAEVDAIVDRLVRSTDRRLAFVDGYRDRLRGPVLAARERMREAVARIPGPTQVGKRSWSAGDATVRALFATAGEASAAFGNDEGVRRFFAQHPAARECLGMLALEIRERHVLAPVLAGESVQVEAARTTVSFAEPRIVSPAANEPQAREELAMRGLEYLALCALERVGAMRLRREQLEGERALLSAQLRLAASRGTGLRSLGMPRPSKIDIEHELERTVRELQAAASRELLPALLEEMAAALEKSGELIELRACTFALDGMNFKVDPSTPQAVTPRIGILSLATQGGPFGVLIARFDRAELRAPSSFLDARFV